MMELVTNERGDLQVEIKSGKTKEEMPSSHLHLGNDPSLTQWHLVKLQTRFGRRVSDETSLSLLRVIRSWLEGGC